MQIVKPDYYDRFNCQTASCKFTCCQDWTITVDEKTREAWKRMCPPPETKPCLSNLSEYTQRQIENYSIKLNENRKCPFLNENRLCRLVLNYGEECLSETCHTFPREKHELSNRTEYTLSVGCQRVLELLWEKKAFCIITEEDEKAADFREAACEAVPEIADYVFLIRDWFLQIASEPSLPLENAMKIIFYLILELNEQDEKEELTTELVREYQNSEIVSELKKAIHKRKVNDAERFQEDNELLLDIADNYRKKGIYRQLLEPIAQRAEYYEKAYEAKQIQSMSSAFKKELLPFETELRVLICEEIYSSCILGENSMYDMTMKLEWLALEYAVLKHWLLLKWDITGSLSKSDLIEITAVLFRMTGYSDDDIEEYLENSFEAVIWDWGYMDLII